MQLAAVPGVTIYGPPPSRGRAALASFNVAGLHATDVSTLLDTSGADSTAPYESQVGGLHATGVSTLLDTLGGGRAPVSA